VWCYAATVFAHVQCSVCVRRYARQARHVASGSPRRRSRASLLEYLGGEERPPSQRGAPGACGFRVWGGSVGVWGSVGCVCYKYQVIVVLE